MEIKQVESFLVLVDELHFGRASKRLHMTQPALSRLIRSLEAELKERLFDRSTRSVELTSAGEALLRPARDFLDAHERAVATVVQAGSGQVGRVRLGFAGASSHLPVSRLVKECYDRHPGLTIELHGSNFADAGLTKVVSGEFDIALGRWRAIPAGIASRVIRREGFVLAVPVWHPRAGDGVVSLGDVAHESFIILPPQPGSQINERLFELSERYGAQLRLRQAAPDTWTGLALVGAGVGVMLTLSTVRDSVQFPGVVFLELSDELEPAFLSLAWKENSSNAAVASVLECADSVLPTDL